MRFILGTLVALAFAIPSVGQAAYPEESITIIVPSKAGGSTDTTARLFSNAAKKFWPDANFVIKNVGGSGGQKGFEEIARAKPDGYTIGMVFTTQVVAHIVSKRAKYTLDSFHVMGNMMEDPLILAVPITSPITNVEQFIAAAKKETLTTAVNGIGSDDFVAAKKFELQTGLTFNLLPTKGSTEQKAMILGSQIDASFMNLSQLFSQHRDGKARVIAILAKERSPLLPDVMTSAEQGVPVDMTATRGYVTPANIDKGIADKLDTLMQDVMKDPQFIADCEKAVQFLMPMTGPDYLAYLQDLQADTQKFYDQNPW